MPALIFKNAQVFDGDLPRLHTGWSVRVAGDTIEAAGPQVPEDGAEVVDCGGRVLMPGLIDAH
ncbi:MAG TPA: hypothetical protein VN515_03500, partial [Terriglobales bacterium]|nr:hypothetical protein [Terriglobales bacterium]